MFAAEHIFKAEVSLDIYIGCFDICHSIKYYNYTKLKEGCRFP